MGLFRVNAALICCLVFFTHHLIAQQAAAQADSGEKKLIPPAQEISEDARNPERHISLDIVAADSTGRVVPGLQQQDFTILDNNQPQKMTSFAASEGAKADPPVEVMLLIDLVNTGFSRVAYERQELDRFLRQNNGQLTYPTTLVVFTDTGTQIQPQPSRNGNALADTLGATNSALRIIGRSAGFYGAEERLEASFTALDRLISYEGTKPGRKLLMWISPGWPLLEGPNIQYSSKDQQAFFHSIVSFTNSLRTSRITLYTVDPLGAGESSLLRTFYYQSFLKGVKKPSQAGSGNLALQVLATRSGGRVLNSSNDLVTELNSCLADASVFYSISFEAAPSDRVNEYHEITIKVDKPGIKARTNAAYYGQP
jgi:VWFA-related protein